MDFIFCEGGPRVSEYTVIPLSEDYIWFDTGTGDSLYKSAETIKTVQRSWQMISCLGEHALIFIA